MRNESSAARKLAASSNQLFTPPPPRQLGQHRLLLWQVKSDKANGFFVWYCFGRALSLNDLFFCRLLKASPEVKVGGHLDDQFSVAIFFVICVVFFVCVCHFTWSKNPFVFSNWTKFIILLESTKFDIQHFFNQLCKSCSIYTGVFLILVNGMLFHVFLPNDSFSLDET